MRKLLALWDWGHWFRRAKPVLEKPAAPRPLAPTPLAETKAAPDLSIGKGPRRMLFIDEPNLARSLGEVRAQGKDLDYAKLRAYFGSDVPLSAAFYYTGYEDSQIGMRAFFRKLNGLGYEVVQVRSKHFRDGSVKNADPDIKIITDLFTKLAEYDEAVLLSGDGDFADTVQHLLRLGKRVKVVSMRSRMAQELRECGAEVLFLDGVLPGLLMDRRMRSRPAQPPVSGASTPGMTSGNRQ